MNNHFIFFLHALLLYVFSDIHEVTITITKVRDCVYSLVQLAEIKFYDSKGSQILTTGTVENPGGNFPSHENPSKLVDGQSDTKWLDSNMGAWGGSCSTSTLILSIVSKPASMILVTANDSEQRDPVSFEVQVCKDSDCTTREFTDVTAPSARLANYPELVLISGEFIILI